MKYQYSLILRMLVLIIMGININMFYKILTPFTVYPVYLFFKTFYNAELSGTIIALGDTYVAFIPACIAASAYLLFTIFLLTTKGIKFNLGLKIFLLAVFAILATNIFRIIILLLILTNYGFNWFETLHLTLWRFTASLFIALLWIFFIRKYRIKTVPIYSDFKYLLKKIKTKDF